MRDTVPNLIKRGLKQILPKKILARARRIRSRYAEKSIKGLSVEDSFDKIYQHGYWGSGMSSGSGSHGPMAVGFVNLMQQIIAQNKIRSIADIGCGDFAVGSQLTGLVERYNAYDVSGVILDRNRARFSELKNTRFQKLNIIEDVPGRTDLLFIRQVLQHLTNSQVEQALCNIEGSSAGMVLIADEISNITNDRQNIDLDQHAVGTRANLGHGLYLERPPFQRRTRWIADIPEGNGGRGVLRIVQLLPP